MPQRFVQYPVHVEWRLHEICNRFHDGRVPSDQLLYHLRNQQLVPRGHELLLLTGDVKANMQR
jgi:hypothetical protein